MKLTPVGELGPVRFGVVEKTPLCAVYMQDPELPFVPLACLTPAELGVLDSLARSAAQCFKGSQDGFSQVVGQIAPKPRTLQIQAVCQGPPTLVLGVLDGTNLLAEFTFGAEAVHRLSAIVTRAQNLARSAGPFPARVDYVSESGLRLRGSAGQVREFQFVPEFTAVTGAVGEYLRVTELAPGDSLLFWSQDSVVLHAAVQASREPAGPPTNSPDARFLELCALGQKGDELASRGLFAAAFEVHLQWLHQLATTGGGELGPFLAAKWTLSLLYRKVRAGQFEEAVEIWTQAREHPVLVPGVSCLEDGCVSAHDFILYQLLTCTLRSLDADRSRALASISALFPEIAAMSLEAAPHLAPLVLRNWQQIVRTLAGEDASPGAEWLQARQRCGRPVEARVLDYPPPAAWVIDW